MKYRTNKAAKRDSWSSRWGFILACIGSAVGMGNIWMFPGRVSAYGGGSFLIPYFIFVIIIGYSGVIGEMAFGRAARSGPMGAFKKAVESRGKSGRIGEIMGVIPVLGSLALAIGYSVVVGWILKYMIGTLGGFVWKHNGIDGFEACFRDMASSFGNTGWQLAVLFITFSIMILGISSGIEKANKIMMPMFFVLFIGIAIYIATIPGAFDGYRYMFTIDIKMLRKPVTWIFALGQAFFSLSLAGNGTLVYGSYLQDDEDIIDSAQKVAIFDTIAAMLAAMVIIPAVATVGERLSQGGPGLMFIYLPNVFKGMPGGRILMAVFFSAVFFAGLSSLINLFEAPIETLQNTFGFTRTKSVFIAAAAGTAVSICIQGIISGWMDAVSIYVCPLGAAFAGIMFYWVYGSEFAREELQKGRDKIIGKWLEPSTKFIFCGITILVLILGVYFGGIG